MSEDGALGKDNPDKDMLGDASSLCPCLVLIVSFGSWRARLIRINQVEKRGVGRAVEKWILSVQPRVVMSGWEVG